MTRFGRLIGSLKPKTADLNAACEALRVTVKRILNEKRERIEMRRKQENLTSIRSKSFAISSKRQPGSEAKYQLQNLNDRISDKCLWIKNGKCPAEPISLRAITKFCHCDSDCSAAQKCCPVVTGGSTCYLNVTISTDGN